MRKSMATAGAQSFEASRLQKRPPELRLEMEKRLKLNLKRVKVPKKLTHTLVSFLPRRNISKDRKQ